VAAVAQNLGSIGKDVGYVYAANTLGAIGGAIVGGLVVLPALGVQGSLAAAGAGNLAVAVILLVATAGWRPMQWIFAAAAALVAIVVLRLPLWDQDVMSSGPAIYARIYRATVDGFSRQLKRQTVVYYRDGKSGTVSVHRVGDEVILRVNGKTDASTGRDMPT